MNKKYYTYAVVVTLAVTLTNWYNLVSSARSGTTGFFSGSSSHSSGGSSHK